MIWKKVGVGSVIVVALTVLLFVNPQAKCLLVGGRLVNDEPKQENEILFKQCALKKPRLDPSLVLLSGDLSCAKSGGIWIREGNLNHSEYCRPYDLYSGRQLASIPIGDYCDCGPNKCWFSTENSYDAESRMVVRGQCIDQPRWHRALGNIRSYEEYIK